MGKYNDFQNDHAVVAVSGSVAATKLSAALDTKGMEQAVVILRTGTIASTGTIDVKIEDSPDNSTWADLPSAVFAQQTDTSDDTTLAGKIKCNTAGVDRYLRVSATAATADADYGCIMIAKNLSGHLPLTVGALPALAFDIESV